MIAWRVCLDVRHTSRYAAWRGGTENRPSSPVAIFEDVYNQRSVGSVGETSKKGSIWIKEEEVEDRPPVGSHKRCCTKPVSRLFKVPYFSVRSYMSIVDGPPFWSLDASETGESTKCPWLGMVEGTAGKNHPLISTLFISPPLTNPNLNSDCCHMPHPS